MLGTPECAESRLAARTQITQTGQLAAPRPGLLQIGFVNDGLRDASGRVSPSIDFNYLFAAAMVGGVLVASSCGICVRRCCAFCVAVPVGAPNADSPVPCPALMARS